MNFTEHETSTHQDHVIAHVIGATVLGHFVFDESIYLLLDIGFFWRIYLDGEMGLLPASLTLKELDIGDELRNEFTSDLEILQREHEQHELRQMTRAPAECLLTEVKMFVDSQDWKLLVIGEQANLVIQASLDDRSLSLDLA